MARVDLWPTTATPTFTPDANDAHQRLEPEPALRDLLILLPEIPDLQITQEAFSYERDRWSWTPAKAS